MNSVVYLLPLLGRWLAVLLVFLGMLFVAVRALQSGRPLVLLLLPLAPLAIMLATRLNVCLVIVLGLYQSWIYIPGLPASLSLFYICAAAMVPLLVATRCLRVDVPLRESRAVVAAWGYVTVVVITMCMRGFGLRMFGSESWGGASNVYLLIVCGLYIVNKTLVLTPRQCTIAIACFCMSALVPALAESIFVVSKGAIYHHYHVIRPDGQSALGSLHSMRSGEGILRFQLSKNASYVFVMCMALFPFRGRGKALVVVSGIAAAVSAGLSGHRTAVLYLLLLVPLIIGMARNRLSPTLIFGYLLSLGVMALAAALAVNALPLAAQRALSWIPFVDVAWEAEHSASVTILWRIEILRRLVKMIPDYWLIGRGFVGSAQDFEEEAYSAGMTEIEAIATHNYHNGPFSMLIDLGIFGLLFGSWLLIAGVLYQWRSHHSPWASQGLRRYHRTFVAVCVVEVFLFYTVHGDAVGSVLNILILLTIAEAVRRTDRRTLLEQEGDVALEPPVAPVLPAGEGASP